MEDFLVGMLPSRIPHCCITEPHKSSCLNLVFNISINSNSILGTCQKICYILMKISSMDKICSNNLQKAGKCKIRLTFTLHILITSFRRFHFIEIFFSASRTYKLVYKYRFHLPIYKKIRVLWH